MVEEKKIRAIIWDMGGVILKTYNPEHRVRLADRFGLTRQKLEEMVFMSNTSKMAEVGMITVKEHQQYIKEVLNLKDTEIESFFNEFWAGDRIDEEIIEFIKSIRKKYRVGLLSNAWPNTRTNVSKEHYDFFNIFDVTIFSAEVGLAKPDPKIYNLILNKLGVLAKEAVFIDDFKENIDGAKNVGMSAIHFDSTETVLNQLKDMLGLEQ